MR
ncbi:hypothetical protein YPPY13_1810, partial [Yersinia pestis PY-13]|jgi:hypothetical protein|eukprot:CCRYP_013000-RD/>CCRYP_013000-RD protein AED:0.50 eAED:0.50 QI:0/-1/0/1/-1/0/1/0/2